METNNADNNEVYKDYKKGLYLYFRGFWWRWSYQPPGI